VVSKRETAAREKKLDLPVVHFFVFKIVNVLFDLVHVNVRDSVVAIEYTGDFLQGRALGFDIDEVHEDQLNRVPESVEQHEVPVIRKILPGAQVGLIAEGKEGLHGDEHDGHALGAKFEGKDFKSVADKETREANVVENAKSPDEDELSEASYLIGLARVLVRGSSDGPAGERCHHTKDGDKEERATTKVVDLTGGGNGNNDIENGLSGCESQLLVLVVNPGTFVDSVDVVGENGVTRILGNDTERDNDSKTPQIAFGAEEVQISARLPYGLLDSDGFLDFTVLELDGGVVGVAASVPLGQNSKSLFVSVLENEVTGGLGDPYTVTKLTAGSAATDSEYNLHQIPTSWITEGTIWMKVMDLHDQLPLTKEVPQPMQETTESPQKSVSCAMVAKESSSG
jgi:hypothetical protein